MNTNTSYITLNLWSVSGKWSEIRKMSGGYTTNGLGQCVPANDGNYVANFLPDFFVSMMFIAVDFDDALQQARDTLDWEINTANEILAVENMGGANYGRVGKTYKKFETSIYSKVESVVIDGIEESKRALETKEETTL